MHERSTGWNAAFGGEKRRSELGGEGKGIEIGHWPTYLHAWPAMIRSNEQTATEVRLCAIHLLVPTMDLRTSYSQLAALGVMAGARMVNRP